MPVTLVHNNVTYKIGKNARENWQLIENAEDDDLWIHLDKLPSCHVIIEYISDLDLSDIKYGCELCKQYSKYKEHNKIKVAVLKKEYVKKGKTVGEAKLLKDPQIITI